MNNLTLAVQTIKDNVSAVDVGEALGLEIRHGRCQCPVHGGHDFNCRLYPGDRGFYCHVCKSGGDVLKLVQESQGMSFREAVAWLNDTFHLGVDMQTPMSADAVKQAEMAQRQRKEEREYQAWKERAEFDLALATMELFLMAEELRETSAPKDPWEAWKPEFCRALRMVPSAKRLAERCMYECIGKKSEKSEQGSSQI